MVIHLEIDNRQTRIHGMDRATMRELDAICSYKVEGYWFDPRFKRRVWDGKEHLLKFHRTHGYRVPTGMLTDILDALDAEGTPYTVDASGRLEPPELELEWNSEIELRDYQHKAVQAIAHGGVSVEPGRIEARGSGIIKLPIRSGKTLTAAYLAHQLGTTAIFLVPSQLLLRQTIATLTEALGRPIGRIGEGVWEPDDVTVASIQTLVANRGKTRDKSPERYLELLESFGLVIFDECFPAGTVVGGQPIEKLKAGDTVTAFNEATGALEPRSVVRTFKSIPGMVVMVRTAAGSVVCTNNHPFWTQRGWVNAGDLKTTDMVLHTTHEEKENASDGVPHVRQRSDLHRVASIPKDRAGVLLGGLQQSIPTQTVIGDDGDDESQTCIGADENQQPDEAPRGEGKSQRNTKGDGVEASRARRQRAGANGSANAFSEHVGLGDGARNPNGQEQTKGTTDSLQSGHREPRVDDCNRSERQIPLQFESPSKGQDEKGNARWVGVDSVELQERGSDGTFGGLCADGHVYNIEVEGLHTYVADGFVVHNCHHLVGDKWRKVMQDFNARFRVGLSATAYLHHEKAIERGVIWLKACAGPIAIDVSTSELIGKGYLVRPHIRLWRIEADGVDRKEKWSGEMQDRCIYGNDARNAKVVSLVVEHAKAGRRVLVVSNRKEQVALLCEAITNEGVDAEPVTGDHLGDEREAVIERFKDGSLLCLVGTVFGEGVDIPVIDAVINAEGGKDPKATMQRLRNLTPAPGKVKAWVDDFIDLTSTYHAEHSRERLKLYRSEPAFNIEVMP